MESWWSRETWQMLGEALRSPTDPDDLGGLQPELVRRLAPLGDRLINGYFRTEIEGLERVPPGGALLVCNHNSGISFLELVGLGARWFLERGTAEPLHSLAHDAVMALPGLGNFLHKVGTVRASRANALALLGAGRKVLVCPGGNPEAFRPFRQRHRIRFGGRKGFAAVALQARVPIVPLVTIGGHEGFVVLHDGRQLARLLRMDRLLRSETFPIYLGLPWGIGVGPIFHLPLPVKVRFRFLEPISTSDWAPEQAGDERVQQELASRVVGRMQQALDDLTARRRFPLIG